MKNSWDSNPQDPPLRKNVDGNLELYIFETECSSDRIDEDTPEAKDVDGQNDDPDDGSLEDELFGRTKEDPKEDEPSTSAEEESEDADEGKHEDEQERFCEEKGGFDRIPSANISKFEGNKNLRMITTYLSLKEKFLVLASRFALQHFLCVTFLQPAEFDV
jgi:hypothetical protein